jgi:hypothetical protein
MEELIIDESNFNKYFLDIRTNSPQKEHIIACYTTKAELISGEDKKRLINILLAPGTAAAASQFMKKIFLALELDSIQVPIDILTDLKKNSVEYVMEKPYKYTMQMLFYTKEEYVPNDPHWTTMEIINNNILFQNCEK